MLRRLFTNLRTVPPPAAPPIPDLPEAGIPAAAPDDAQGREALRNWLKWDRLPPLDAQAIQANPARTRAAQLLALSTGEEEAQRLLRGNLASAARDGADLLLLTEISLRHGKTDEAIALLEGLAGFAPPSRARAACIRGQLDFDRGEFAAARHWADIALAMAPRSAAVQLLDGTLLEVEGRLEQAARQLRSLIAARPDDFNVRTSLAVVLERQGRMAESLQELVTADMFVHAGMDIPAWDGRDLGQDTLLITTTAGIGDILQHLRYVKPVRAQAPHARLVLWTRAEVAPAARLMDLFDEVRTDTALDAAQFHWQVSLARVAMRYFVDGPPMALSRAYVHCAPAQLEAMRTGMAQMPQAATGCLRVGLRWFGAATRYNARRSVPTEQLRPLFDVPGIAWIALLENGNPELARLRDGTLPLADVSPLLNDMADTAALMRNLDLVISVDTSTAHLAGAVGAPCWLLARPDPDARWGLASEQSTLYDSVRIFRHPDAGRMDWPRVIADCARALAELAARG